MIQVIDERCQWQVTPWLGIFRWHPRDAQQDHDGHSCQWPFSVTKKKRIQLYSRLNYFCFFLAPSFFLVITGPLWALRYVENVWRYDEIHPFVITLARLSWTLVESSVNLSMSFHLNASVGNRFPNHWCWQTSRSRLYYDRLTTECYWPSTFVGNVMGKCQKWHILKISKISDIFWIKILCD